MGEQIFQVIGKRFPQILEGIYRAASPTAPVELPSGAHQIQLFLTFETFQQES